MTRHPFYPTDLALPHYRPAERSTVQLLAIFFAGVAVLLGAAYWTVAQPKRTKKLSRLDQAQFLWFVLCGAIHLFFEGYFAATHRTIAGDTTLFAEIWKEYALSDSRYMSSDSFVVVMESITAVCWGVGSFALAYAIRARRAWRFPLQFLVSTGQLYGDVLYYFTTLLEGAPHCNPHPFYFYGYFVLMNAFWIVFPLLCMWQSWSRMTAALSAVARPAIRKGQ